MLIFIYMLLVTGRTNGRSLGSFQEAVFFGNREHFVEKCSHVSLSRLRGNAVASLSPRRPWFSLRVVSERCVVDREARDGGFS